MNKVMRFISVAGAGAGLMYFFDPDRGKRRRALVRNKAKHLSCITVDAAGKTQRDIRNHLQGLVAEVDSLFRSGTVTDEVLTARVRSKLGRFVSHAHAVEVTATDGVVMLTGPILADEIQPLLDAVIDIDGVVNIDNRLQVHTSADVPALQGGRRRQGERFGPFKTNWSPTTRLLVTAGGGALALYGLKRRGLLGSIISAAGTGVVTRALTNLDAKRLIGFNGETRGIEIEKTINVDAGLDEVFTYWSHPENFPEFMTHVREVRKIGEGLYRWIVGGPAGLSVEWDAQITDFEFNKLYAWKSLPGSMLRQSGATRFDSNPDGSTRIDVKMSYLPPAGALGHMVAELFGVDPKHEMDDDLMRMKSFIETRIHPHDAAKDVSATRVPAVI
jgi:uncharacterized membrane protein